MSNEIIEPGHLFICTKKEEAATIPPEKRTLYPDFYTMDDYVEFIEMCFDFDDTYLRGWKLPVSRLIEKHKDFFGINQAKIKSVSKEFIRYCKKENIIIDKGSRKIQIEGVLKSTKCYLYVREKPAEITEKKESMEIEIEILKRLSSSNNSIKSAFNLIKSHKEKQLKIYEKKILKISQMIEDIERGIKEAGAQNDI